MTTPAFKSEFSIFYRGCSTLNTACVPPVDDAVRQTVANMVKTHVEKVVDGITTYGERDPLGSGARWTSPVVLFTNWCPCADLLTKATSHLIGVPRVVNGLKLQSIASYLKNGARVSLTGW